MARLASRAELQADYPAAIRTTKELKVHSRGLLALFHTDASLAMPIRPTYASKIRYHIEDASAEGFAAGTQYPDLTVQGRGGL